MSDQAIWKRKYTDLTLEVDQQRHADSRLREQLNSLVSHLSMGLQGSVPDLDAELDALNAALQAQDNIRVPVLVRQVKTSLGQYDQDRYRERENLVRVLQRWGQQLRQLNRVPAIEAVITDVEVRAPAAAEQLHSLVALIGELVDLQHSMLGARASGIADSEFELNTDADQDLELLQAEIARRLMRLLEVLQVPAEGVERARNLVLSLEQGLQLKQLPDIIATLTDLIRLVGGNSQEDFENYLMTLNSQLAYVQQFLEESRCDEEEARAAHRTLDDVVRRDVRNIHRTVKDSEDLGQLKQNVTRQLASIMRSMEHFKLHEQERENRLGQRYDDLLKKVDQMELETSKARARMQEEQLRARTDPLTGLPNRIDYEQHLKAEMDRWERYKTHYSLAVGDIDFFKRINDQLGHLAGDRVLRLAAKVLRHNLRSSDFIARFGGEEFVILFPSTKAEEAWQATEKLRLAIQDSPFNFKGERVDVTLSFGVAEVQAGDDMESLFTRADKALYRAKEQGRNQTQRAVTG
ncbi:diguanylate cyclase (GGDEF)-like protein [Marinobacterium halophilum]|uniref:diguanylate cyclase n=1 Tax=Marinobacterium halophilum TaxID=267374 RepID=A0A2P8EVV1_9GAMM|nr:GGDEF domain-containing protein [Marinobacterium halophilum]PSL13601.1 diguanylate cyclase (GGDEF)-like protein [Marinobacterium halophilum]